jgi:hypothetical protein
MSLSYKLRMTGKTSTNISRDFNASLDVRRVIEVLGCRGDVKDFL